LIAIRFRYFSELHAFREVALNRLASARDDIFVDVAQHDFVTGGRRDLRDAVAHRTRAEHSYTLNRASSSFVVPVRVRNQRAP